MHPFGLIALKQVLVSYDIPYGRVFPALYLLAYAKFTSGTFAIDE